MEGTTVEGNRIKGEEGFIFVDDTGAGNLPVVFTHSFGGDASHWAHQLTHFSARGRVVALDFRGHGESDASSTSLYTSEALANDIVAVVDGLDIEKFVLVGHSMGGLAAIAYADVHPQRVAGLVMAGTPGKTPVEISEKVITSLQSDAYEKVMNQYMERLVVDASPEVAEKVNDGVRKLSRETSIKIIKAQFDFDPIPKIERYKGPKLIICTSSELEQPNALHNQTPGVPYKIIAGTSHWPQLDKPEVFNQILDDFLKKISKS